MKTRTILSLGLSAMVFGGVLVGCSADGAHPATASARSAKADTAAARSADAEAKEALARHDAESAVRFAEVAVRLSPRDGGYRATLGRSYLQDGRFASARAALSDALVLVPQDGRSALDLALATIALGDLPGARSVLAQNAAIIPASDRGLALALAGDPQGAVQLLTAVARSPATSAKVRQNLALSLALAGEWPAAKIVAAADMSPADVDQRLQQWAAFAQPRTPSDQVATLLGVRPAADAGMPTMLALAAPIPVGGGALPSATDAATRLADAVPEPTERAVPVAMPAGEVRFAERHEVVQPLPAPMLHAGAPMKVALSRGAGTAATGTVAPKASASGDWYVQVGAYDSAAVAHDSWTRIQRRSGLFAGRSPNGATVQTEGGRFYRLSVGGFARADADGICRSYRRQGGRCFVRRQAGDTVAQWVRGGTVQVASR